MNKDVGEGSDADMIPVKGDFFKPMFLCRLYSKLSKHAHQKPGEKTEGQILKTLGSINYSAMWSEWIRERGHFTKALKKASQKSRALLEAGEASVGGDVGLGRDSSYLENSTQNLTREDFTGSSSG